MSKTQARVAGEVSYAEGDGITQQIPIGPCEVETTASDATISWVDGDKSQVAALPIDTYETYLSDGKIVPA